MRHSHATRALLAIAAAVAIGGAPAGADDTVIDARLTVAPELPQATRRAMVQEAQGIWRKAGVRIAWDDDDQRTRHRQLRVLVVRGPAMTGHSHDWTVGKLMRFDDGTGVAIASIARAEEIVQAGAGHARALPESIRHHRLGVVLGRAVAHEIGHYLLESGAHARHGLMRATFLPREFTDLRSGAFEVDERSRRQILQRVAGLFALHR